MRASKSSPNNMSRTPSKSLSREDLPRHFTLPSRQNNRSLDPTSSNHGSPNSESIVGRIVRGRLLLCCLGLLVLCTFLQGNLVQQNNATVPSSTAAAGAVEGVLSRRYTDVEEPQPSALRALTTQHEATTEELRVLQEAQTDHQDKHQKEVTTLQTELNDLQKRVATLELELAQEKQKQRELPKPPTFVTSAPEQEEMNAEETLPPSSTTRTAPAATDDTKTESVTTTGTISTSSNTTTTTTTNSPPRYAYTWVLGGIDPTRPAYKGFLYDILISVHLLKKLGSTSDFIVLTQLSHNTTGVDELPPEDKRLLTEMDIIQKHLPRPAKSSFAQLVYEKFRPLLYTEYDRIMFLDGDILPLNNLDYLFRLSAGPNPILRPNLVVATRGEPCNTGLFIMHPTPGAYEALQTVIQRQHEQGLTLPYPHFSWTDGWGHNFQQQGDLWESVRKYGDKWRFHAGHSDQGLWYYFTKYFLQDASIVIGSKLQTVTPGPQGQPQLQNETHAILKHAPEPILYMHDCEANVTVGDYVCNPVYRDFAHFMGPKKPWASMPCTGKCKGGYHSAHRRWYQELKEVNDKLSMGLDVDNFKEKHLPEIADSPLGYIAKFSDHQEHQKSSQAKKVSADHRKRQ